MRRNDNFFMVLKTIFSLIFINLFIYLYKKKKQRVSWKWNYQLMAFFSSSSVVCIQLMSYVRFFKYSTKVNRKASFFFAHKLPNESLHSWSLSEFYFLSIVANFFFDATKEITTSSMLSQLIFFNFILPQCAINRYYRSTE